MDQRFSESLLHSFYLNTTKQWATVQNGMCDDKRLLVDTFEPECSIKCFHKQTLALIELSDIKILDSTPCTFTYLVAFILWIRSRTTDQGTAGLSTYKIFICCNIKKQKHTLVKGFCQFRLVAAQSIIGQTTSTGFKSLEQWWLPLTLQRRSQIERTVAFSPVGRLGRFSSHSKLERSFHRKRS